jgi:hypothetical protein
MDWYLLGRVLKLVVVVDMLISAFCKKAINKILRLHGMFLRRKEKLFQLFCSNNVRVARHHI